MNCAEIEILICDYVDGTLPAAGRAEVERHLAECRACAELARDSAEAVAFIERAASVEPPPELITRILFNAPWSSGKPKPAGWRKLMAGILSPVLQPRFAMGMAMTILSLSLLYRYTPLRKMDANSWKPARIVQNLDTNVHYAWQRTVKFYENLKFVYQIQNTLHEWQQQDEEQRPDANRPKAGAAVDGRKLPVKSNPGPNQASGSAPSSNPAGITQ
jgi:hypothetical protein